MMQAARSEGSSPKDDAGGSKSIHEPMIRSEGSSVKNAASNREALHGPVMQSEGSSRKDDAGGSEGTRGPMMVTQSECLSPDGTHEPIIRFEGMNFHMMQSEGIHGPG